MLPLRSLALVGLSLAACSHEPLAAGFEKGLSPIEGCVKAGLLTLVGAGPGDRTALLFSAPEPKPASLPATVTFTFNGGVTTYALQAQNGNQLTAGHCAGTAAPQVFNRYSALKGQVKLVMHAASDLTAYEVSTVGLTLHDDGSAEALPMADTTLAFLRSVVK